MKKILTVCICLLFTLTAILPLGMLISALFGYTFELTSILTFSVIIAVISVLTAILGFISKEKTDKKITVLSYILTPLSLINAVLYIFESTQLSVAICVFVSVICCFCLTLKNVVSKAGKIIISVLFAISTAFIVFFAFIMLTFGSIGKTTVDKTVDSPDNSRVAQVIIIDQGALGGNTVVDVCEKKEINAFIFRIKKKPQRVHMGEWGEAENMQIYWEDNNCLVVNSVEYEIE